LSITKQQVINRYLPTVTLPGEEAEAFAPSNIALCKYWGKRNKELNLPINSSLSISLDKLGSHTKILVSNDGEDRVFLNGKEQVKTSSFSIKVIHFLNLFRRDLQQPVHIYTENNIPTAAGLASSASGFAALMLAIDQFYHFNLEKNILSAFARIGSGSASRSIYRGFVEWHKGSHDDGMDSHAEQLEIEWPDFRVALLKVATGKKAVDSRSGMQRTTETASLYQAWPQQAASDLDQLKMALFNKDFEKLGQTIEQNALSMPATMIASWPPLVYWQPESVAAMHRVWNLRSSGVPVYLTMDAGPNLKLLFLKNSDAEVKSAFPELTKDDLVKPFAE
jgi:diphosphomevalonate decarboxylase